MSHVMLAKISCVPAMTDALAKFIAKGITMESRAQGAIEHGASKCAGCASNCAIRRRQTTFEKRSGSAGSLAPRKMNLSNEPL